MSRINKYLKKDVVESTRKMDKFVPDDDYLRRKKELNRLIINQRVQLLNKLKKQRNISISENKTDLFTNAIRKKLVLKRWAKPKLKQIRRF